MTVDQIIGVCRYCRASVRQADVDEGLAVLVLWTPEGGGLYSHANTSCIPKDNP